MGYPGMPMYGMPPMQPMYGMPPMQPMMSPNPGMPTQMMMPPRAPVMPPAQVMTPAAPPVAAAPPQKMLQAYVGKIPETVPEEFLKQLLELCGTVAKWERVTDPTTGKPKPFGFCKFVGQDSVLRALRLLNGLETDGGALLVKVDQKTQALLDEYSAERAAETAVQEEAQKKDNEVLESIAELLSNRAATASVMSVASPAEEARDREAERQEREANREKEREERRKRDEERAFQERERDWERRESDRARDKAKRAELDAKGEAEKQKRAKECAAQPEPEEFAAWWDKYQDRMSSRRRIRAREAEEDDADRRKEEDAEKKEEEKRALEAAKKEEDAAKEDCKKKNTGPLTFGLGGSKRKNTIEFDKEEDTKKMKFTPIEYTDEERLAREAAQREAQPERTPEEKEAEMKRLIKTIPTAKADLLTYGVNWEAIDKGAYFFLCYFSTPVLCPLTRVFPVVCLIHF